MDKRLKVLVADDEQLVCVLIQDMIDWEGIGLVSIGNAYDGNSAYRMICEQEPDIVLTDIRMPGKDGLELIRLCQKENRKCEFVAISGHKEFEYAHSAIQYGVNYFLVKPINEDELNGILADIKNKYAEQYGQIERQKQIQMELEKSKRKIQDDFLNAFRTNPKQIQAMAISQLNQKYMLRLRDDGRFLFFIVRLDGKLMNTDEHMGHLLHQAESKLKERLAGEDCECIVQQDGGALFCLAAGTDMAAVMKGIEITGLELVQDLYVYVNVTVGMSRPRTSLDGEMVREAEISAARRIDEGVDQVIYPKERAKYSVFLNNAQLLEFLNLAGLANVEGVEKYMDGIKSKAMAKPAAELYLTMRALLGQFHAGLVSLYGEEDVPCKKEDLLRRLASRKTKREMYDTTRETVISYLADYNEMIQAGEHWYIREAKQYVQEHYSDSISLEDVARCLHISPTYFSTVFKQQEGVGFVDYLLGYRMEIAKKMLRDRNCNISELAEKIGYRDQKYFSKLFKKVVGVTASEYKKLHGR